MPTFKSCFFFWFDLDLRMWTHIKTETWYQCNEKGKKNVFFFKSLKYVLMKLQNITCKEERLSLLSKGRS